MILSFESRGPNTVIASSAIPGISYREAVTTTCLSDAFVPLTSTILFTSVNGLTLSPFSEMQFSGEFPTFIHLACQLP